MSLNWNYETDCIGSIHYKDGAQTFLYSGNALFIEVTDTKNPCQLVSFACDKTHLENMLGLHPKHYSQKNIYDNGEIEMIVLHSDYEDTITIVKTLLKAKWEDMPQIIIYQV